MAEYVPYYEKLRDPRWQKKRLEIMQRDEFKCVDCGDADSTLNVHHCYYLKGTDPWDYEDYCLKTLCEPCHEYRHDQMEQLGRALSMMGVRHLAAVAGFAKQLFFVTGGESQRVEGYRASQTLAALHSLYTRSQVEGAIMAACGGLDDFKQLFEDSARHGGWFYPSEVMESRRLYADDQHRDEISLHT